MYGAIHKSFSIIIFVHALRSFLSPLITGKTRFRVVTLAGQLIEVSGAMSGGGRPSKGRMGSSVSSGDEVSPEKLAEMQSKLTKGREKHQEKKNKVTELVTKREKLQVELQKMKAAYETSNMELKVCS